MPVLKFNVKATSENPTKTLVSTRGFTLVIDEPQDLGGTNAGPNPVEYVLGALCGCLNVVGHLVANEMGFKLRGLAFEAEGDLDPAKFMGQPTPGRAGYTAVRVKLLPDTDADKDTLSQWLRTVESRCPVSDNVGNATPLTLTVG